jgi:hypothetical protein
MLAADPALRAGSAELRDASEDLLCEGQLFLDVVLDLSLSACASPLNGSGARAWPISA